MPSHPIHLARKASSIRALAVVSILALGGFAQVHAQGPTVDQAFGLKPLQADVHYDAPTEEELARCKIESAKLKGGSEWIVKDSTGRVWRRFQDTNADNRLDQWCYFKEGVEAYRDIDVDFNGNVDRYRWAGPEGIRLGVDADEDGVIDAWDRISVEEAAFELIEALRTKDAARLAALLPTEAEIQALGLDGVKTEDMTKRVAATRKTFPEVAQTQTLVREATKYVQFGASRPNLLPSGTAGLQKDVYVYDQATAIVENDGRHGQVMLGAMVLFGSSWKPVDLPQNLIEGADATTSSSLMFELAYTGNALSSPAKATFGEDLQKLIAELETLDRKLETAPDTAAIGAVHRERARVLADIIRTTPAEEDRENWVKQYAESIAAAAQTAGFAEGPALLKELEDSLLASSAPQAWVAFVRYRRLQAEYALDVQKPEADFAKIQEAWLGNLTTFVDDFPATSDAVDAMLNLATSEELADKPDEALAWYRKIVVAAPETSLGRKAQGAVRRLDSEGKPLAVAGKAVDGREFRSEALRGKVVLVHYWATWCKPCIEDMKTIRELQAKYGQYGFVPVGVNIDPEPATVAAFLKENRLPWTQLYEAGGMDSRLAVDLGVSSLPTMVMIDAEGKAIGRNVTIGSIETILKQNLRQTPSAGAGAAAPAAVAPPDPRRRSAAAPR